MARSVSPHPPDGRQAPREPAPRRLRTDQHAPTPATARRLGARQVLPPARTMSILMRQNAALVSYYPHPKALPTMPPTAVTGADNAVRSPRLWVTHKHAPRSSD